MELSEETREIIKRYIGREIHDSDEYFIEKIINTHNQSKSTGIESYLASPTVEEIKKEYENFIGKQLGSNDKDDWDKVVYIDFEGLWNWIEQQLVKITDRA